eukprot:TRINITY_DN7486_c0_g1_i2.p1 TRINITY_DN7486_c0_g1~~TRINITY_DN7486_c0_g1_i2.p1  ORF type:complete len:254 (-),score=57.42 TRINITY_DN7486_c0_g1_i2:79-840(-)
MVIRPESMKPNTYGPVLMDVDGVGDQITGEVWLCDDSTMEAMDILEGVPSGLYYSRETQVIAHDEELCCTVYFYPPNEVLLRQPLIREYGAQHHELYKPGAFNRQISALCQFGPSEQLLHTQQAAPMMVHVLRLLPDDDLLEALLEFVRERQIHAAMVLTCVGSTGTTVLRPAGSSEPKLLEGKFEIVSLTGTLGAGGGHHLHMSVSDLSLIHISEPTRLLSISYAVFCLKKKKKKKIKSYTAYFLNTNLNQL